MMHTVVFSDVHLAEAEPGDGLWMRYRQRRFSPDREIAEMLSALRRTIAARADTLVVVLNGDIFDFDAPRVVGGESVFHDLPRDAAHAVPAMEAILRDNPHFVTSLGAVLADGHSVVFVSGNHDAQLTLPDVRAALRDRLVAAARDVLAERGERLGDGLAARIVFRAWIHRTSDGIVVEHGNQYDPFCSFRYPMAPYARDRSEIQPTMGSLAARLLVARMGYFNPHVEQSFLLTARGYMWHWLRYYAFSRRSLLYAWASGAVRMLLQLVRRRDPEDRRRRRANIAACTRETKTPVRVVARHARLFARPAEDRLSIVVRELWVDRVVMVLACLLLGGLWLGLTSGKLAFGALFPLSLWCGYELWIPKVPLAENWRRLARVARKVARIHGARAVLFGHTHQPEGSWEAGVFYGNTGSWSAAFRDIACTEPLSDERPLVWLCSDAEGTLSGGLVAWKAGRFEPRVVEGDFGIVDPPPPDGDGRRDHEHDREHEPSRDGRGPTTLAA